MRPFFPYYGAKWKLAKYLQAPHYPLVIEPFAGSACYSCYWDVKEAILVERNPLLAALWRWLIKVSPEEILALPTDIDVIAELPDWVCAEARTLIGFAFTAGQVRPAKHRTPWAQAARIYGSNLWSDHTRKRVAQQVQNIRNWRIIEGDYTEAPDVVAHWHIDPPYLGAVGRTAGCMYTFNEIDYEALAVWCRARKGLTHVCEHPSATWLPFKFIARTNGALKYSEEGLFEQGVSTRLGLFDNTKQRRTTDGNHRVGKRAIGGSRTKKAAKRNSPRSASDLSREGQ
jgi:hypothetical protein